jgi:hypothetical protein
MANPHPNMSGLIPGGKPWKATRVWREFCEAITVKNEVVLARYRKEMENGMIDSALEKEIWHYTFGVPPKKIELEMADRQRPGLRTLRPIGYDPLNPDKPDVKVMEAIYSHVPPIAPRALPAGPEAPVKGKKAKGTIVPRPEIVPPQREPDPPGVKRRVPKRPPEDDGMLPLRVDGV